MKKNICNKCNTELSKTDKTCFNCGELNPIIYKSVSEGIISGILSILCSDIPLLGFLSVLSGFTYSKRIKGIDRCYKQYILIIVLTVIGLILTIFTWIFKNI